MCHEFVSNMTKNAPSHLYDHDKIEAVKLYGILMLFLYITIFYF